MGDHEGRRHDLEAKHPLSGRLLHPGTGEGAEALAFKAGGDAAQHFGQIGAGAATRVEHIDVWRGETLPHAEVVLQRLVDPCNHVADNFGGRVPDAELLAQLGIEGFEERLVEIRHRLTLLETGEKGGSVHAVERRGGPVQHLDEAERLQAARV